jgi:hypothetical protein
VDPTTPSSAAQRIKASNSPWAAAARSAPPSNATSCDALAVNDADWAFTDLVDIGARSAACSVLWRLGVF